jgi:hypothetical protein
MRFSIPKQDTDAEDKGEKMSASRTMWKAYLLVLATLFLTGQTFGQFPWQKPMKRDPAEVKRIVGPIGEREPSRDLNIVWVWGIDKLHEKETHEYAWVMDRYVNVLLPQIPRVTVTPSMYFPKKELWEKADLVVFYMWTAEVGRGRVFVSGVGHNYFTFNDPYFRIILLRAMAWTMRESFDPFKPLVTLHLER